MYSSRLPLLVLISGLSHFAVAPGFLSAKSFSSGVNNVFLPNISVQLQQNLSFPNCSSDIPEQVQTKLVIPTLFSNETFDWV